MEIPRKNLAKFVREISDQCMISRQDRANRGNYFQEFVTTGSDRPDEPAFFNKTFTSIDDLESLLFSPVGLKFHIADPDIPNILNEAKGRSAAAKIRQMYRQADLDTMISQGVNSGLVKGCGIVKQNMRGGQLSATLVAPEDFGVLRENYTKLDENMGAFTHSMFITMDQFVSLVANQVDRDELVRKAKRHMRPDPGKGSAARSGSAMNIVIGGMYPVQTPGGPQNNFRGQASWMGRPQAAIDPSVDRNILEMQETWIWDDDRDDWATFQIVGDDILILGKYSIMNAMAYDRVNRIHAPELARNHPYRTIIPNPMPDYFWGVSEVGRLVMLQEAINSRITGTNRLLRKQEDPPTKFVGATGVNQNSYSRFNKPGGWWSDSSIQAKIERDNVQVPQDLWASLHEYERMFDEMMGLPPTARGHGEKGVRSANHAEALVRMFSPRFKDRALLVERDVESLGALTLDLCRAHIDKKLVSWVPEDAAGAELTSSKEEIALMGPPAPGTVPVFFTFGDLPEDVRLTVDSHSSSPAFSADAKALVFDMLKVGIMAPEDAVEHLDVTDPDELIAGIQRRNIAKTKAHEQELAAKAAKHSK